MTFRQFRDMVLAYFPGGYRFWDNIMVVTFLWWDVTVNKCTQSCDCATCNMRSSNTTIVWLTPSVYCSMSSLEGNPWCKLSTLITAFLNPSSAYNISMAQYFIQEISQIFYYASFSMNFFLYALYGKHFQRSLSFMYESLRLRLGCSDRIEYLERTSTLRSWT